MLKIIFFLVFRLILAEPSFRPTLSEVKSFLSRYGYFNMNDSIMNLSAEEIVSKDFTEAVKLFQTFNNLQITGNLDDETTKIMSLPRCSLPDINNNHFRKKRHSLANGKWRRKYVVYEISKYPTNLGKTETDEEVSRAFNLWSNFLPFKFTNIDIRFESYLHRCTLKLLFDGPQGMTEHAFNPDLGGDIHFDDDENWTFNSSLGTDLFQTAVHAIGHSIGLEHSNVKNSVMNPFLTKYDPNYKLGADDIQAIQALYDKKDIPIIKQFPKRILPKLTVPATTPLTSTTQLLRSYPTELITTIATTPVPKLSTSPPFTTTAKRTTSIPKLSTIPTTITTAKPKNTIPNLCEEASYDTIFTMKNNSVIVFKEKYFWKLTENGIEPDYPKLISDYWIDLPNNIWAAFTDGNGHTYFFKSSKYWKYDDYKMIGKATNQYPKNITVGFPGIPNEILVAVMWNERVYFFKDNHFWKYEPNQIPQVTSNYPKPVSNWKLTGLNGNLDAAVVLRKNELYFFKKENYWIYNAQGENSKSRNVKKDWFQCPKYK